MPDRQTILRTGLDALEHKRYLDAASIFSKLVTKDVGDHQAWCGLSAAFLGAAEFEKALQAAKTARASAPGAFEPWYVVAPAAFCAEDEPSISEAMDLVKRIDRNAARTLVRFWADRLCELERIEEAAEVYDVFVKAHGEGADIDLEYAEYLLNAYRPADARPLLDKIVTANGSRAESLALRARLRLQMGEVEPAKQDALSAIRRRHDLLPAYVLLAEIDAGAIDSEMCGFLSGLLRNSDAPADSRVRAGFALGRALEQQGNHEAAFDAYTTANAIARSAAFASGRSYDRTVHEETIKREKLRFPEGIFAAPPSDPRRGEGLIFITGMPRSGSTLLDQILASHSNVTSAGESSALPRLYREILRRCEETGRSVVDVIDQSADEWESKYRRRLNAHNRSAPVVVDKLLPNFWRIGLIARLFPAAKIIITERNPMDTGLSIFRQNLFDSHSFSCDLADIAHQQKCFEAITAYWRKILPSGLETVAYEEFISDLNANVPALLATCGLPMEEACLAFESTQRSVFTLSAAQVRRGLSISSLGRWRQYEKQLEPLKLALETIRVE